MATNTRNARASAVDLFLPWGRVSPAPDGNIGSLGDREHIALSYELWRPSSTSILSFVFFDVFI